MIQKHSPLSKYYLAIGIAVIFLALCAIVLFLIIPTYNQVVTLKTNNNQKSASLAEAKNRLIVLENLNRKKTDLEKASNFANHQVPETVEATNFVSDLNAVSRNLSITPLTVSVNSTSEKAKNATTLKSSTFNLTFEANFENVIKFLVENEKLPRLNTISSITLAGTTDPLKVSLSGQIYFEENK